MLENGCTFEELDVALMMHGGPATQVDVKSLALNKLKIVYHGVCSHAALKPEKGRSALDGLILACQGVEFLREHVPSDVRMHYTIVNCGGTAANVVPGYAEASMYVRSYNRTELDGVVARVRKVLQGAAMMTETEVEIVEEKSLDNKIPVLALNELVMEQAEKVKAPLHPSGPPEDRFHRLRQRDAPCTRHLHPRGLCPGGAAAHSQEYLDAGKTEEAHNAVVYGAKDPGSDGSTAH